MRFGQNLHLYQVPLWAEYYIEYRRLKTLVKAGQHPEFCNLISQNVKGLDNFVAVQTIHIKRRITAITTRYTAEPASIDAAKLQNAPGAELIDLSTSLLEIAEFISQLDWFLRVNQEGFSRIATKLESIQLHETQRFSHWIKRDVKIRCIELLREVNDILCSVHAAMTFVRRVSPVNSLALTLREPYLVEQGILPTVALQCILDDDSTSMQNSIQQICSNLSNARTQTVLRTLLQTAIIHGAPCCCEILLPLLRPDSNHIDDYIHHLVIQMGRTKNAENKKTRSMISFQPLRLVLESLHPSQQAILQQKDFMGRIPLHYAAAYGLEESCEELLTYMKKWCKHSPHLLKDDEGETPLSMAVRLGHTAVVHKLCESEFGWNGSNDSNKEQSIGPLIGLCIRSNSSEIFNILLSMSPCLNYRDMNDNTLLYLAAQFGRVTMVAALLEAGANADELTHTWSPLLVACIQGHRPVVELLLRARAGSTKVDWRGWSAKDHASFRGYPAIVKMLQEHEKSNDTTNGNQALLSSRVMANDSCVLQAENGRHQVQPRQCDTGASHVFVHLGSFDLDKEVVAVDISPYRSKMAPINVPQSSLLLEISAVHAQKAPYAIQLPLLGDDFTKPLHFMSSEQGLKLSFKLFTSLNKGHKPIGSAVASLDNLKHGLGPGRESLVRDYTISLTDGDGDFTGTLTFTFIAARPFTSIQPPNNFPTWPGAATSTRIGGHRGLGQNDTLHKHLQIGENTIASFAYAIESGADCIEFDVQVTKDSVPVIYHDFLVNETGTDAAMHMLTHADFMALNYTENPASINQNGQSHNNAYPLKLSPRRRAVSLSSPPSNNIADALVNKIQHTFGYKTSKFKGNMRGEHIHEPFTTLQETLQKLPESVQFNIELKYPMHFEAIDWKLDPYALEANTFIDAVLRVVYEFGGSRSIIFSSFSPELCQILQVKQQAYPVLFLNDSSNWHTPDLRATSLQTAMQFARAFDLQGVVMASEPLIASPKLIPWVKDNGLFCASYGAMNDDTRSAKIQADAGLDLLIVNRVGHIVKALRN